MKFESAEGQKHLKHASSRILARNQTQLNKESEQTEKPNKLQDEGERLAQWNSKVLHGTYPADLERDDIDKRASLLYLIDGFLYPETEGFYMVI